MKQTPDFWVGDRVVRPSLGEIQRGLEAVHLEPRSIEVLVALSERAGDVASKEELIEAVWGDSFVSDEVLTHAIWDLRRAFGDNASNPEFIQTIPKRGYRLIAPVKPVERDPGASERGPRRSWRMPAGLIAAALVLTAVVLWVQRSTPLAGANLATLMLVPTEPFPGTERFNDAIFKELGKSLAGTRQADFVLASSCDRVQTADPVYCIEAVLTNVTDSFLVSAQLIEASSQARLYTTDEHEVTQLHEVPAATAAIAKQVDTYLEVVTHPDFADLEDWISFQDRKILAVLEFLAGFAYSIRNVPGSGHALETAIRIDPDFIAPRVWRTGAIVGSGSAESIQAHRDHLDELYLDADLFEKPMIRWALAYMDFDAAEQLKQVSIALGQAPGNRPLRMLQVFAHRQLEDHKSAWRILEPILDTGWHYPGLYALAAETAFELGSLDDARRALRLGLKYQPIASETLAMHRLLALFDEKETLASEFSSRLAMRLRQEPGAAIPDVSQPARFLAEIAESEGRKEISQRLREFVD